MACFGALTAFTSTANAADLVYDFSSNAQGFSLAWADSSGSTVAHSSAVGDGALLMDAQFTNPGWSSIQAGVSFAGDLSNYESLEFDVYAPVGPGTLKLAGYVGGDLSWSDYDLNAASENVTINGVVYAKVHYKTALSGVTGNYFVLRVAGQNYLPTLPIYVDDVVLTEVQAEPSDIVLAFDSGTEGSWVPSWDSAIFGSPAIEWSGVNGGSLKANVNFQGGGWDQGTIEFPFAGDAAEYSALEYDVLVPVEAALAGKAIQIASYFNGPWRPIRDWTYTDLSSQETVTVGGKTYWRIHRVDPITEQGGGASSFLIRFAASGLTWTGPVHIDNVTLRRAAAPEPEIPTIAFDFEDGTTQGWSAAWGGAFDESKPGTEVSSAVGSNALAVNVAYNGEGWDEANVQVSMAGGVKPDLSFYKSLEYDVYMPNPDTFDGYLKMQTALNDGWREISGFTDYSVSDPNALNIQRVVIGGTPYAKIRRVLDRAAFDGVNTSSLLVIRLAASGSRYAGPVYIDNIRFVPLDTVVASVLTPSTLDTVSGAVDVKAKVILPRGETLSSVALKVPGLASPIAMTDQGKHTYATSWDSATLPDGFHNLEVVTTTNVSSSSKFVEVQVKNSGTEVEIVSPTESGIVSGTLNIVANVTNSKGQAVNSVVARIDDYAPVALSKVGGQYKGSITLDPKRTPDGVYSLVVEAKTGTSSTKTWNEVIVDDPAAPFRDLWAVSEQCTGNQNKCTPGFALYDEDARVRDYAYSGWNAYDLPFKYATETGPREKVITYTNTGEELVDVLPARTPLPFEELVDRSLIEAKKRGFDVVRTWAFNSDRSDAHSYYTSTWGFKEEQFRRLDYVMEAARRHHVKVILTLQNYWSDYGGINALAARFGKSRLEFFSDPALKQMYREYVQHLVTRVNSVNGISYAEDPTVFAWELMNEPRMDYYDDPTADKRLYDPNGSKMAAWIDEMSTFIKDLDPRHMVATGSEGHGFMGWGRTDEGWGSDPTAVMNQENVDFFTFHPYMNAPWARYSVFEAKQLIREFIASGLASGKPVVMEEWGYDRQHPVVDLKNTAIEPNSAEYEKYLKAWFDLTAATSRRDRGNAQMVWMLWSHNQDGAHGLTTYRPAVGVGRDKPILDALTRENELLSVLGTADYLHDVKHKYSDLSGYIYEAVHLNLMSTKNVGGKRMFEPDKKVTDTEFLAILRDLGVNTAGISTTGKNVSFEKATDLLRRALQLSRYDGPTSGNATLARMDLLPLDEKGDYSANKLVKRSYMAALIVRVKDFLLYQ
jgi:endo-1,4-beta-mannosidase